MTRSGFPTLVLAAMLGACSEAPEPVASNAQLPDPMVPTIPPVRDASKQLVSVSEGTNLSLALSPDGTTLVVSIQGVLFSLPVGGGAAKALTGYYYDAREPSWSPDGNQLVFHGYRNGTWDLWAIVPGSAEPIALTNDPFDDREARYSPLGDHIAFSSDRAGNYDIWLYAVADGGLIQVTDSLEDEYAPTWSPDGTQIAYAATLDGNRSALRRMELTTAATATVIEQSGAINGISWKPDGRKLTYQLAGPDRAELRVVATAGGEASVISEAGDDVFPFTSAWLDEQTQLYAANGAIFRQSTNGQRRKIPFEATFELDRKPYQRRRRNHDDVAERRALGLSQPTISADGTRIAFTALGDLWLFAPDDGSLENLTDSVFAERSPTFSPSGTRLAYVSDRPNGDSGESSLWIYDLVGQGHQRVDLQANGLTNPSWSPDGQSIALFASASDSPMASQLRIVDLSSGALTNVHTPVFPQRISWSTDGNFVATTQLAPYSGRYREGVYRLIVASPTTGEHYVVEPVAHKNITHASLTPSGQAMTYVQDGQLWRQDLTEDYQVQGYPEPLTAQLTDTPSWSSGGEYLVFMNADHMLRLDVDTGETVDVTPAVKWRPDWPGGRWTILIGRLFDGVGDGYLENALLTIEGNRISHIETDVTDVEPDVDARDKAAFPGLFEMHAHMGETSESQGRAWLAWGVTSVRDPGSDPYVAKERQEFWDSGRVPGPRTHVTGYLADGNRVYYSVAEGIASDVHLERALERAERLELDLIKTYVRLPDHRQKRVVEFAHAIGIPVSSHELFPAAAHGMDHVEHIGGTSRRGYRPKVSAIGRSYGDVISLLAASGMGITPTAVLPGYPVIASAEPDLFDTAQFKHFYGSSGRQSAVQLSRMLGGGVATITANNGSLIRDLAAAGALLVTGTDSPFVPYGAGLHAELRLFARAGLSPAEILKAASVRSAKAAGVEHDIGTLQPGMLADFVVVDGDPLASIQDADNVVLTVKNGRAYSLASLLQPPADD